MEEDQKILLREWKPFLAQYLNPIPAVEALPEYFPVGSMERDQVIAKENQQSVAASIIIEHLMKIEKEGVYMRFLDVIKQQKHDWLLPIITGRISEHDIPTQMSNIEYYNYVTKLFTVMLPHLKQFIVPEEISEYMQAKNYLTQEEAEKIKASVTNSGNTVGARMLIAFLVRKPLGWLKEFKEAIRVHNYATEVQEVLDDIPDSPQVLSEMSMSSKPTQCADDSPILTDNECCAGAAYNIHSQALRSCFLQSSSIQAFAEGSTQKENMSQVEISLEGMFQHVEENETSNIVQLADLHGTVVKKNDIERCPVINSAKTSTNTQRCSLPANNIIPKEAGYTPLLKRVLSQGKFMPPRDVTSSFHSSELRSTETAVRGENVIIMGQGNQHQMIVQIIKSRFPSILDSTERKIALLVPASDDIKKKYSFLDGLFASQQWSVDFFLGDSPADLERLMRKSQVIVMAAPSLLDWLYSSSDIHKLSEFDMLIFDQCGDSCKDTHYKDLLLKYLRAKQSNPRIMHPQVIGLTNTIGTVNIWKQLTADEEVWNLVALFDAVGGIELLSSGSSPRSSKKKTSSASFISDHFTFHMHEVIDSVIEILNKPKIWRAVNSQRPSKMPKGSRKFINWCYDLEQKGKTLEDFNLKNTILTCARFLYVFNVAFLIRNKCRPVDGINFLWDKLTCLSSLGNDDGPESRLKELFNRTEKNFEKFRSMTDVNESKSLKSIQQVITTHIKGMKNYTVCIAVSDREIINPLESWTQDEISNSKRNAKSKTKSGIQVHHVDDLPDVMQNSDLLICYDCEVPLKLKSKSKHPKTHRETSNPIITDERLRVAKALVIERAIEKLQEMKCEKMDAFLDELRARQNALLAGTISRRR